MLISAAFLADLHFRGRPKLCNGRLKSRLRTSPMRTTFRGCFAMPADPISVIHLSFLSGVENICVMSVLFLWCSLLRFLWLQTRNIVGSVNLVDKL